MHVAGMSVRIGSTLYLTYCDRKVCEVQCTRMHVPMWFSKAARTVEGMTGKGKTVR